MIDLGLLSHIKQRYACQFCRMITEMFDGRAQDEMILKDAHIHMKNATDRETAFFVHTKGQNAYRMLLSYARAQGQPGKDPAPPYSVAGAQINWSNVRAWLEDCNSNHRHSDDGSMTTEDFPENFKLVDIRRKCIIRAPKQAISAALGYVWGGRQDDEVETTRSNLETFSGWFLALRRFAQNRFERHYGV